MRLAVVALLCLLAVGPLRAAPAGSVYLQELTSPELRDAIRDGARTVIVPVGGTEQNGAHMVLGKHNLRVHLLAGRIAAELGHTLVAPVITYVPEGRIDPPTEHMRYAGTISIGEAAFKGVLEGAARSLARHGFTDIVFIGDHGGYQSQLQAAADALNRDWKGKPARAHYIGAYYAASQEPFVRALRGRGLTDAQIGLHAGAADTALMLAVDPAAVRPETMRAPGAPGVSGDPSRASAELGRIGADLIVQQSIDAIRKAVAR
jgi:creatinine amidohydrolase/Fe(II)-dependent formamide hydrolase-like protein